MKIAKSLYFQIICAVILGVLVGHFWAQQAVALKPLGDAFIKLIKMMIAPVVFCTIVTGIAGMSDKQSLGRLMSKTLLLFLGLTVVSLIIGLVAVYVFQPGTGMNIDPAKLSTAGLSQYTESAAKLGVVDFFMHIIPETFVGAFNKGEVLPVLFIAVLSGFALSSLGERGKPVLNVLESASHMVFKIFSYLMRFAPIGAFGALAFTVGQYGITSLGSLAKLIMTLYIACGFFVFVVLGSICRANGFSLWKLLRYFREEFLVVLGTSSTEPVMPRMLEKLQALGCKKGVVGLVLPTGYSFNLDGTAIYLSLAAVFIAQACNIELSMTQTLTMLAIMLLSSKGAAGVTGSGFVALASTLTVIHDIPLAGLALLIGVDRFMSEARALTSLASNAVATVAISLSENACDRQVLMQQLDNRSTARRPAPEWDAPQVTERS
ncbi:MULTISPECIES: dicarboxylate/amino acid:cation symporter [Pseudomonas syringae group]|uniref:Aerobic C4-dicarboxylate transporter n=1 Tax=Pseudomonas syringae pv. primulae TaxID=251707 RepID=A0A0P9Y165_9PSED|nr:MULTISPECIES: dicarboxylate/amino acid:cation symporter [Pseudomonas syringae group]KPY41751.1 Aerobic C4-dicarboxylate transporter [Pseudomonas syringae pv. primulae]MBD8186729.1 dicarboxylate/amino acid:cation symporter [Pseudomonas viridiflava]MBD8204284.1 dicarboxylate/amino acid:cation symporter [Pseudomonas viridiflava]TKJ56084.1 dicarboxylate/amino acid:cation symporter [Pseudomonas viridiflava]TKK24804.1 dicarboxylate/amino acid:cation symporter [Pseudomonas viridiflava]